MSMTALPAIPISPITGVMLPSRTLVPNRVVHNFIKRVYRVPRAVGYAHGAEL